jgi:hypothetical protein
VKRRILSLSIQAMFRPLGVVAGAHYSAPRWPIFPVAWPVHESLGRPVRVRWPSHPSDELFDFNALLGEPKARAQTIALGGWTNHDDIWDRSLLLR